MSTTCKQCGIQIANDSYAFCPNCGEQRDAGLISGLRVNTRPIVETVIPKKTASASKAIGVFLVGILILSLLIGGAGQFLHRSAPPPRKELTAPLSPEGFLASEFYKNIGITHDQMIESLGRPTSFEHGMYIYERHGWRQMYSLKKDLVDFAFYQKLDILPQNILTEISALESELEQNGFHRISNIDNVKRYRKARYEVSIFPMVTDANTYNLSLLAFRK